VETSTGSAATKAYDRGGKTPKQAAVASWIGSVLEYYDFFIYGTAAALVFGKVFFPAANPTTGTLLSLATYGVAYVARPIGAVFMGHLGDRSGRKRVLVLTVTVMGAATFLVGCLPTYGSIGIWAPVLLVALRLVQGLAASGEQAGANSVGLEHAPERHRSLYTSFTLGGTQAGLVIATAIWLPIGALPEHQLLTWGWRVPFLLSAIVTITGLLIRRRLNETPSFQQTAHDGVLKLPLAQLLRDQPADVIRVTSERSLRRSARSSPFMRCRSRSRRSVWTTPRCCGWRSWPTSSRWPPSPRGPAWPTGSDESRCSSSARSAAGR
jgi:MFS family permease